MRCYPRCMVAADLTTDVLPFVVFGIVALIIVVWLVLTRVFGDSRAGRHAAHFLDVGGADMPPDQRVKYNDNHPGAGGHG
jgi:hypothetical protein